MKDIENTEDIQVLVNNFYDKVRQDKLLAPIFNERIAEAAWSQHLQRMYSFWATVLLFQKGYRGNPFAKHRDLAIDQSHFQQWITHFKTTVDEQFQGHKAEEAKRRADNMAIMFSAKIAHIQANPNYKPIV